MNKLRRSLVRLGEVRIAHIGAWWQSNSLHIVSQVDLVPTLALLFGLPIPKNSLGSIISELFNDVPGTYSVLLFH